MKRRVVAAGILAGALAIAGFAGSAAATNAVSHYYFSDCTSTDGSYVPSSFEGVKTLLPGSASHPVSAASAFVVVGSTDVYTVYNFGFGAPYGITVSGVADDSCWVYFTGIGVKQVWGQYNPGT